LGLSLGELSGGLGLSGGGVGVRIIHTPGADEALLRANFVPPPIKACPLLGLFMKILFRIF
jgi:hypothetical protein